MSSGSRTSSFLLRRTRQSSQVLIQFPQVEIQLVSLAALPKLVIQAKQGLVVELLEYPQTTGRSVQLSGVLLALVKELGRTLEDPAGSHLLSG